MDGVQVGERAVLQGCIVGRRAVIGKNARLTDCEVQDGFVVADGLEAKGEKMSVFEGLGEDDGHQSWMTRLSFLLFTQVREPNMQSVVRKTKPEGID